MPLGQVGGAAARFQGGAAHDTGAARLVVKALGVVGTPGVAQHRAVRVEDTDLGGVLRVVEADEEG
jgi:hypothetical protein